jgi:hypothetical protein
MSWFPNQPDDQGLVFVIILSQVVAAACACASVHVGSGWLMAKYYHDAFKAMSPSDQRQTQAEVTSFVMTIFLVPCFIAGAVEVSGSIDR